MLLVIELLGIFGCIGLWIVFWRCIIFVIWFGFKFWVIVFIGVFWVIDFEGECIIEFGGMSIEGWLFDGGDFVFSLGEGFLLLINGGGGGMVCLGCLRLWGFIIVGILG